jgi:hypothetical protein
VPRAASPPPRPPEPPVPIAPRPAPVNAGARDTIPPIPFSSDDEYDEDLLDSLHLSPTGDDDEVMVEDPDPDALSFDTEEPLEVVDDDDGLGRRPRPPRTGTETVASTPREAEDLRRRIARPLPDELDLEHIEEEEQEVEEISLEPPLGAPAAPSPAPKFRPYLDEDLRPGSPVVTRVAAAAVPVSVDLVAGPGQADVAIPVEIVLNNGTAQVNLHVRLTLNLKVKQ